MTKITKAQIEYVINRIDKIKENAIKRAQELYLIKSERKLTTDEMKELVATPDVPFKKCISSYELRNVFNFSRFENESMYDDAKLKEFSTSVGARANAIKDSIILGTAADAEEAINGFAREMMRKLRSVKGSRPAKVN